MLKLKNISKYYSRQGTVALGLKNINLTLGKGEFVAVIGESGSGKSTLLNVISGIDTYEDGEMLINNEETSHFSIEDWEKYRRNYIGFIFQNYNIIESYTVLQNVEVALILSGYDPKERRQKALEIIDKVGMTPHQHMKASKLSGGQMQRTVIARALAKDAPIIAADEPTGNLDSKTSKQIIDLLSEISKDKLVIIVTHNYEEVKDVVNRKITLHNGEVVEDRQLKEEIQVENLPTMDHGSRKISFKDKVLMAFQNVKSTPVKTLLMFIVLFMLTIGSSFVYGTMLNFKGDSDQEFQNSYFHNSPKERVVLKKQDNTSFKDTEIKELSKDKNVIEIIKSDIALDETVETQFSKPYGEEYFTVSAKLLPWSIINKEDLSEGRMPKSEDEIVINTYAIREGVEIKEILDKVHIYTFGTKKVKLKVVGIIEDKKKGELVYLNTDHLNTIEKEAIKNYKEFSYSIGEFGNIPFIPVIHEDKKELKENEVIVNEAFAYNYCTTSNMGIEDYFENIKGKTIEIESRGFYEVAKKEIVISDVIENKEKEDGEEAAIVYFNKNTYNQLINPSEIYQISMFVDNENSANNLVNKLKKDENNYEVFYPFGTIEKSSYLFKVIEVIAYGLFIIVFIGIFFFISYFILRNIIKSKKKDYVILRSIGATSKFIRIMVFLEISIISSFSYFVTLIVSELGKFVNIKYLTKAITSLFRYYRGVDYLYIYLIILCLSFLLTRRFSKKVFDDSVMTTLKGEEVE